MAKKIVGLIGNGRGPVVHTDGDCTAMVEGLQPGGIVIIWTDTNEQFVLQENGPLYLGKTRRVSFEAQGASRDLICNVLMEI